MTPHDDDNHRDLDDALMQYFQATTTSLPDAGFSQTTSARIRSAHRRRRLVLAFAWLGSFGALLSLAPIDRILGAWRAFQTTLAHEPALWACLVGLLLLAVPAVLSELFSSTGGDPGAAGHSA